MALEDRLLKKTVVDPKGLEGAEQRRVEQKGVTNMCNSQSPNLPLSTALKSVALASCNNSSELPHKK